MRVYRHLALPCGGADGCHSGQLSRGRRCAAPLLLRSAGGAQPLRQQRRCGRGGGVRVRRCRRRGRGRRRGRVGHCGGADHNRWPSASNRSTHIAAEASLHTEGDQGADSDACAVEAHADADGHDNRLRHSCSICMSLLRHGRQRRRAGHRRHAIQRGLPDSAGPKCRLRGQRDYTGRHLCHSRRCSWCVRKTSTNHTASGRG
mmetsp:Transcript_104820/g.303377  ORF Transcript_104820/g.303377 Transcript_104820/m.303377 type:complete len:203 (-) Transcript_104820:1153-1761(-)